MQAAEPAFLRTSPPDRPLRGRRRSRAGFSLVEVMVAILLMSVIVVSTFSVALTAKRGVLKSERKIMAGYASTARRSSASSTNS